MAIPLVLGINAAINLQNGERLSIVGCGGKTSLVGILSRSNSDKKVLIMTTTHIRPPHENGIVLCTNLTDCLAHQPRQGIQCLGVIDEKTKKFRAPPQEHWPSITQGYDLVLMEADGSRSLPCKGWGPHEPVVPSFTTHTIGVVTLLALGKPANEHTVHRMAEFEKLTALHEGERIDVTTLADMVGAPGGMFKNACGHKLLLINQVEDAAALQQAQALAAQLRQRHPHAVDKIFAGSVIENNWRMV